MMLFLVPACQDKSVGKGRPLLQPDTTITPAVAFTRLKLDSLAVDAFIRNEKIQDSTDVRIRNFYRVRNYQYAWFDNDGLTDHGEAFWNLHQQHQQGEADNSDSNLLHKQMKILINEDTVYSAEAIAEMEIQFTEHFLKYIKSAFNGKVEPEKMQWYIPRRKVAPLAMLDSFLADHGWKPLARSFYKLNAKLRFLRDQQWSVVNYKRELKTGMNDVAVIELKHRLHASGEFASEDSTDLFTPALEEAVKRAQKSFVFKQNGIVNNKLVKALNVPAEERKKQVLINLERMRWMPEENRTQIVVNIPEFKLHVYEQDSNMLNINIVVGKAANRTVIFSNQLKYIVFSPFWNIPKSITRNEILPGIMQSKGYLQRNNMEITGYDNGLPVVRQKPGKGNALGRIKFLFPNSYNIYFHDTPAKSLFKKEKRAFSHGCIRLEQPVELAKYLLRYDTTWTEKEIEKAMNRGTEKWVTLPNPIPVYIVYFTAWVDKGGILQLRDDIYGHDKEMMKHLFE